MLRVLDEADDVAPADVGLHQDSAPHLIASDLVDVALLCDVCDRRQWNEQAVLGGDGQPLDGLAVRHVVSTQAEHEVEHTFSLAHDADALAGSSHGDGIQDRSRRDAETRSTTAIGGDVDRRQAERHLHLHVGGAVDLLDDPAYAIRGLAHRGQVVAEHLHDDVTLRPGDEIVDAHLDRLTEGVDGRRGHGVDVRRQLFDELLDGEPLSPFGALLQENEDVRGLGTSRIDGVLRATDAADHAGHFRRLDERQLALVRHEQRLVERDRRYALGVDRNGPFEHARQEVRTDPPSQNQHPDQDGD